MHSLALILTLALLYGAHFQSGVDAKQKRPGQSIRKSTVDSTSSPPPDNQGNNNNPSSNPNPSTTIADIDINGDVFVEEEEDAQVCPPCAVSKHTTKYAVHRFWNHDIDQAYACACNALKISPTNELSKALILSLRSARLIGRDEHDASPSRDAPTVLKAWDALGPINIGKLELDADPTFSSPAFFRFNYDIAGYLLAMPDNASVSSDLVTGGQVTWQHLTAKGTGQLDIHYNLPWNEIAQGLGTALVYEYLVWLRSTTYLSQAGSYVVTCQNVHTLYLRNENMTRIVTADVYGMGSEGGVIASLELKAGIVGIVIPVRVLLQRSVRCELKRAPEQIVVYPPDHVPNLLEVEGGQGVLLTPFFSLPIHNPFPQALTVEVQAEPPMGLKGGPVSAWQVREVHSIRDQSPGASSKHTPIAPGQTLPLALQLYLPSTPAPLLPCREKLSFSLLINPSKGKTVKIPLDLVCRAASLPFLISYVDFDETISSAAVILPLLSPSLLEKFPLIGKGESPPPPKQTKASRSKYKTPIPSTPPAASSAYFPPNSSALFSLHGSPVLLTLHGAGSTAMRMAEAYKVLPAEEKEYIFGVPGLFVLSPGRFGAHNWEDAGYLSALTALKVLHQLTLSFPAYLPLASLEGGVASGHSMGGHGAWVAATSSPHLFSCVASLGGWVKKEEYGEGNSFFSLDLSSSFTSPSLKHIFQLSWTEYEVDKLVSNLKNAFVHIRVGSHDQTTSPWYSRRMSRLLIGEKGGEGEGREGGIELEEVGGKTHWWWDSKGENDGGVVNDLKMRDFYKKCVERYLGERRGENETELEREGEKEGERGRENSTLTSLREKKRESSLSSLPHSPPPPPLSSCSLPLEVTVMNPGVQYGYCGAQVTAQERGLEESRVRVEKRVRREREECRVKARNVKRLLFSLSPVPSPLSSSLSSLATACHQGQALYVNNHPLSLPSSANASSSLLLEICLSPSSAPSLCPPTLSSLERKLPLSYGPLRHLSHRPLLIVYGTPPQHPLRLAMRDLATYLAQGHYQAYRSRVPVISDVEFRALYGHKPVSFWKNNFLGNVMFIGDMHTNKLMKSLIPFSSLSNSSTPMAPPSGGVPLTYRLPTGLSLFGYPAEEEEEEGEGEGEREEEERREEEKERGFRLDSQTFSSPHHGLLFTFPLQVVGHVPSPPVEPHHMQDEGQGAMGVCLTANSPQGYLHLSRLAWPVIPPMVRSPFSLYLPDYVVVGEGIWAKGPGGILAAGYWDSDWKYSEGSVAWA